MFTAHHAEFAVKTRGKGTQDITPQVARVVADSRVRTGLATVFLRHTSASLIIYENADPTARRDLEGFMDRLVPENQKEFVHTLEGPDDMPSHLRTVLTATSLGVPVAGGKLQLGTWQGVFLFEHRDAGSTRAVAVSVIGE